MRFVFSDINCKKVNCAYNVKLIIKFLTIKLKKHLNKLVKIKTQRLNFYLFSLGPESSGCYLQPAARGCDLRESTEERPPHR